MGDTHEQAGEIALSPTETAARLRQAMTERGWTRADLVAQTGMAWATLAALLDPDSARQPYPLTLARVALALNKPWHWLGAAPPADIPAGPGRRLVKARLARGLTIRDLAALAGVTAAVIHRIEQGQQAGAQPHTWRDLAQALQVPLYWLRDGHTPPGRAALP